MNGPRLRLAVTAHTPGLRDEVGHKEMVDLLVDRLPADLPPPGLVVLAYAAADLRGHQTVASYLNLRTGGQAHSFAVSGQGLGAPFSALRTAQAYTHGGTTAAVAVVECRAPDGLDACHRPRDGSGVLLVLGGTTGPALDTEPPTAPVRERLAPLVPPDGRLLLVLGAGASASGAEPPDLPRTDVHQVRGGGHATSVWTALARHRAEWEAAYPVVALYDMDPLHGTEHLAVLRTPRAPVRAADHDTVPATR